MHCLIDSINEKIEKTSGAEKIYGGYRIPVARGRTKAKCDFLADRAADAANKGYEFLPKEEQPAIVDKSYLKEARIRVNANQRLEELHEVKNGKRSLEDWNEKHRGEGANRHYSPHSDPAVHAKAIKDQIGVKALTVNPAKSSEYIDPKTGETFRRVTSLGKEKHIADSGATARGNIVDLTLRDFVTDTNDRSQKNNAAQAIVTPRVMSVKDFETLFRQHVTDVEAKVTAEKGVLPPKFDSAAIKQIYDIFVNFSNQNNYLVSDIPTLWGNVGGETIAGTVDIINIDGNGRIEIIDLKTSVKDRVLDDTINFHESDVSQQSHYAELIRQRTGEIPIGSRILAIQMIEGTKGIITSAICTADKHKMSDARGGAYQVPYNSRILSFPSQGQTQADFDAKIKKIREENGAPLGQNFAELAQWKKEQLEENRRKQFTLKNVKGIEAEQKRALLAKERDILESQARYLFENKEFGQFTVAYLDLKSIQQALESGDQDKILMAGNKLRFYNDIHFSEVIVPKDGTAPQEEIELAKKNKETVDAINAMKTTLTKIFKDKNKEIVLAILEKDGIITDVLKEMNSREDIKRRAGKKEISAGKFEDFTVKDLLTAEGDIDVLSENILGIISSFKGDTVIPQYIYKVFENLLHENQEHPMDLMERMDKFNSEHKMSDQEKEIFFSKDEDGERDGFLINAFSEAWFGMTKAFGEKVRSFKNSFSGANRTARYKIAFDWILNNSEPINFFNLKAVYDEYGKDPKYSQYFSGYNEADAIAYEKKLEGVLGPQLHAIKNNIMATLQNYHSSASELTGTITNQSLASRNIWQFMDNINKKVYDPIDYQRENEHDIMARAIKPAGGLTQEMQNDLLEIKGKIEQYQLERKNNTTGLETPSMSSLKSEIQAKLTKFKGFGMLQEYADSVMDKLEKGQIEYTSAPRKIYFSDFENFPMVPKHDNKDHFSEEFETIKNDENKSELWKLYHEAGEYINNVYGMASSERVKIPMVKTGFFAKMASYRRDVKNKDKSSRGVQNPITSFFVSEPWRVMTENFFSKQRYKKRGEIVSNNYDSSAKEIKELAKNYMLTKGMNEQEALKAARKEVNKFYFGDIDSSIKQMLTAASVHRTRHMSEPIIMAMYNTYENVFGSKKDLKTGQTSVNIERTKGKAKLDYWIQKHVYNISNPLWEDGITQQALGTDELKTLKAIQKAYSRIADVDKTTNKRTRKLVSKSHLKRYTQQERVIAREYKQIVENGITPGQEMEQIQEIDGKEFYFKVYKDPVTHQFKYKTNVKMLKENGVGIPAIDFSGELNKEVTDINDSQDVTEEQFHTALGYFIELNLNHMGSPITISSAMNGLMAYCIYRGLALNPISGAKNRGEGILTNTAADMSGEYWTPGNYMPAKDFMGYSNLMKVRERFINKNKPLSKKREQLQVFEKLLERFGGLHKKYDTIGSGVDTFDDKVANVLFDLAINLPERKNQGEVVLCLMMDEMIEVPDGKGGTTKVPFFDKATQQFTLYHIKDGELKLKDEYEGKFDLYGEQMKNLRLRMTNVVSRVQGNFAKHDGLKGKASILGRMGLLFKTYLPEHINSRYSGFMSENEKTINVDINTRGIKKKGRYAQMLESDPMTFTSHMLVGIGLSSGWLHTAIAMCGLGSGMTGMAAYGGAAIISAGTIPMAAAGAAGIYMLYKRFAGRDKIVTEGHQMLKFMYSLEQMVTQTWNTYPRFLSGILGKKVTNAIMIDRSLVMNKDRQQLIKNKDEIMAIKACTAELASKITMFLTMILVNALLRPGDDEEEDTFKARMYNQLTNNLVQFGTMSDPATSIVGIYDDVWENMLVKTIEDSVKCVAFFMEGEFEKSRDKLLALSPIPKSVHSPFSYAVGPTWNLAEMRGEGIMGQYGYLGKTAQIFQDEGEGQYKKLNTKKKKDYHEQMKDKFEGLTFDSESVNRRINMAYDAKFFIQRKGKLAQLSHKQINRLNTIFGENQVNKIKGLSDSELINTEGLKILTTMIKVRQLQDLPEDERKQEAKKIINNTIRILRIMAKDFQKKDREEIFD